MLPIAAGAIDSLFTYFIFVSFRPDRKRRAFAFSLPTHTPHPSGWVRPPSRHGTEAPRLRVSHQSEAARDRFCSNSGATMLVIAQLSFAREEVCAALKS